MDNDRVICFGQQPCGFLPRRFLVAKMRTARRVQQEIGGRIVFFYHDSDHDPRETLTILTDRTTGEKVRINFTFANKIQKKYTPLYAKRVDPEWQQATARRLHRFTDSEDFIRQFAAVQADTIADFCLAMYRELGLIDGMDIVRSSDRAFREAACTVEDYFVDVQHENEVVRARRCEGDRLQLHRGGDHFIDLPPQTWTRAQVSPTRDTRLRWMQSVIQCTHYIAGAGEMKYLKQEEAPGVTFIARDEIDHAHDAYLP